MTPGDDTGNPSAGPASDGPAAEGAGAKVRAGGRVKLTWREFGVNVAQLVGMCTFALAGPLLGVLQEGGAFLVAQRLAGASVVLFVVAWIVVPPLVPIAIIGVLGRISATLARRAMAVLFGLFVALGLVGLLPGMTRWPVAAFVGAWVVVGVGLYLAYRRWSGLRQFATALVLAPLVIGIGFLMSGQIRSVAFAAEIDSGVISRNDVPVVFVLFDEFALGTMLTPTGDVNADLFPNFARLADTSTWYPEAITGAGSTVMSVPSLLSGQVADPSRPPSAAQWPNTLFTAVGQPDNVSAFEVVTALCPSTRCRRAPVDVPAVGRDSMTIMVNRVLPVGLASQLVPPVADAWVSFGQAVDLADLTDVSLQEFADQWTGRQGKDWDPVDPLLVAGTFASELSSLGPGGLAYMHLALPHTPYRFLSDGTRYNGLARPRWMDPQWSVMGTDPGGQVTQRQRMVMQSMFADQVLGTVLDKLESIGLSDQAMVVVTSDHGISLDPGGHRRGYGGSMTQVTADDVLPVPLFVRYPGQTTGTIDRRDARLIDVMPTVVEVLEIDLDDNLWSFDGVSLLGEPVQGRPRLYAEQPQVDLEPSATASAQRMWLSLGERAMTGDLFAIGPHADLLGKQVGPLEQGVVIGASVSLKDPDLLNDVDPSTGFLPLLVRGSVIGVPPGTWLVASATGTIAGLGLVHTAFDGETVVEVMLQPNLISAGPNILQIHAVDEATGELRRLR
jgi:hypothetical protein